MAAMRARRIGGADFSDLFLLKLDVQRLHRRVDMIGDRRAKNWRCDPRARQRPGKRDLSRFVAARFRNLHHGACDVLVGGAAIELVSVVVGTPSRRRRRASSPARSAQIPARHRAIRNQTDRFVPTKWDQFALVLAPDWVVMVLDRNEPAQPARSE